MGSRYDVIVLGAGVNGLTAAARLARAGRRILVVERRAEIGGSLSTRESFPGFRVDAFAHDTGWVHPALQRELELERHGLSWLPADGSVFVPGGDGFTLSADVATAVAAIGKRSAKDAAKWPAFCDRMTGIAGFLERLYTAPPPNVWPATVSEWLKLAGLGRRLRGLGGREMVELMRALPMSAAELLDDWFETPELKAAIGAAGIAHLRQGPRAAGTAFVMLHHKVGQARGAFRARRLPKGGVGELARALAAAARAHGAEIRLDAAVERILVEAEQAAGVVLQGGEEIRSTRVASGLDPRRTVLDLVGADHLDPSAIRPLQNLRFKAARAKVNLAVDKLPRFAGADDTGLRGLISIAPTLDYLERAYDAAKYRTVSPAPYLEVAIPTVAEPDRAPAGKHLISVWMQYVPYRLDEGPWDDARRKALGDLAVEVLGEHAPELPGSILYREVFTPADLERELGITEGHLYHGEMMLDQILFMRPTPGDPYLTPLPGLYLCGPGAHPGGGHAGAAGWIAAGEILKAGRG